jgi:hypothetical protein
MPDVQYANPILENPIENLVWIPNQQHDAHARSLLDWWRTFGRPAYPFHNRLNAHPEFCSDSISENSPAIGRDLAQIA